MARVLYIRPPRTVGNGVAAYAETLLAAFDRYGGGRHELIDLAGPLVPGDGRSGNFAAVLREKVRGRMGRLVAGGGIDLFWSEIGLCDFVQFHGLMELRGLFPAIPSLVTLHDPPATVVNLNPWFHPRQDRLVIRVLRKIYNGILGAATEKRFFGCGHAYVVLSRRGGEALTRKLASRGRRDDRVYVVPHINYHDGPEPGRPEGVQGCLRLGYLGGIAREKGIDTLLHALGLLRGRCGGTLPGIRVEIAGAPSFRKDERHHGMLLRLARAYGLEGHVRFLGRLPDRELPGFFADLDILVLPYRTTGSGSASGPLMWARSFGVPVIASSTRNFPEMIEQMRDGMLFAPGDADALADCIMKAATVPGLLRGMRAGALRRGEECNWRKTVDAFTGVIDDMVS